MTFISREMDEAAQAWDRRKFAIGNRKTPRFPIRFVLILRNSCKAARLPNAKIAAARHLGIHARMENSG